MNTPRLLHLSIAGHGGHGGGTSAVPERVAVVDAALRETGADAAASARIATDVELQRVHEAGYLAGLPGFRATDEGAPDGSVSAVPQSGSMLRRSSGLVLAAVDALEDAAAAAFVVVHPPGHLASSDRAVGCCSINHVAVAAGVLRARGERVLIVDWDAHHGIGTERIFRAEAGVLCVSLHEASTVPGEGLAAQVGDGVAKGLTVNVPMPPGATGDIALAALDVVAEPAIHSFRPTWTILAAGFDAHRADPDSRLAWSAGDYWNLTRRVLTYGSGGQRILVTLEGGRNPGGLRASVTATARALLGLRYRGEAATSGGPGRDWVLNAAVERERALREA